MAGFGLFENVLFNIKCLGVFEADFVLNVLECSKIQEHDLGLILLGLVLCKCMY